MACDSKLVDMSLDEIIKLKRKTRQVVGKEARGHEGRLTARTAAGAAQARPPTHKMYRQHRRRQNDIMRSQEQTQRKRSAYSRQLTGTNNTQHNNFQQQRLARIRTTRYRSRREIQSNNRQFAGHEAQVRGTITPGRTVQTCNNIPLHVYQQYLAQARALIQAQQECRIDDDSLYVDVPVRSRGFWRGAGRGRFRR
ncbi:unnamed protein product [Mesocestoides corti]|uniref:POP1 domain-containing protein n=1 Tax=Mesocestoides corti TaxID=53468 RepID=A0A0R3U682_MESCO|nr:unnamed protein product [Mesocestoides corti]